MTDKNTYVQEHILVSLYGEPHEYGWQPHKRETWKYRYARLRSEQTFRTYLGYWDDDEPKFKIRKVPKGTKVKIVMVSRMGDVGITTDLKSEHGYGVRVALADLYDYTNS